MSAMHSKTPLQLHSTPVHSTGGAASPNKLGTESSRSLTIQLATS